MHLAPSVCEDPCYGQRGHSEIKRDTPQINGSYGAFVAVVVCLVLVIVVACSAIFYLLRDQRAFDAEQAHHPKRNHPQTLPDSAARAPWPSRLKALFGQRPDITGSNRSENNTHSQTQMRGDLRGWIQAGSTDDWEFDAGVSVSGPAGVQEVVSTSPPSLRNTRFTDTPSPVSRSTSDSASSVRFSDGHGLRGLGFPELRSQHSTLPNIHSQLSSPSTSPQSSHIHLRTVSPEPLSTNVRFGNDSREYVGSSGMVMRTLSGGTKFVEGL